MSFDLVDSVLRLDLRPGVKLTLVMLAFHTNSETGDCFPSVGELARGTGLSRSSVQRSLRTLRGSGLVRVVKPAKRWDTPRYQIDPSRGVPLTPLDHVGGVTGTPLGGVRGVTETPLDGLGVSHRPVRGVTVTPKQGIEQVRDLVRTRSRDLLFEAVAEACGWEPPITKQARGWINGALPQLREIGATPDDVLWKARVYRANYDGKHPTPSALVKHWPALSARSLERVDQKQLNRELADRAQEQRLRRTLEGR